MKLDIEDSLYRRLERRADEHGFESAEEYGAVLLETVIEELETERADADLQERLSDLGYLE